VVALFVEFKSASRFSQPMSDKLQLVVKILNIQSDLQQVSIKLSVHNLDDKLKLIGHCLCSCSPAWAKGEMNDL
jgi:hypothetical protein